MKVFVATWWHTWGEYSGILGVYPSHDRALDALKRLAPRCFEANNKPGSNAGCDVDEFELGRDYEGEGL